MTLRLRDWPERLDALLAERRDMAFTWGRHDCCLFAADAVAACSGIDLAEDLRGSYGNAAEGMALLQQLGGVEALADAWLGPAVVPQLAQPGDIGLVQQDGRDSLAVCGGSSWQAPGPHGLVALPIDAATKAWRLPVCRP